MYCRPAFGSGETDAEAAMRAAERARDSAQANAERARPPGRGPGVVGFIQDMQQANRQKKVGKLMAAGQCDEARKTALAAGDLGLADYVQSRCGGSAGGSPQLTQGSGDPSLPPAPMDDTGVRMWVVRNVQTAGWVYAGFDGDGAYLYSAGGPIANPDGTFQLWVNDEVFRPRPQEPASGTLRYEGDCAHRLLRVTKLVTFSRRNLDGDSTSKEFPEAKWEAPQGLAADLLGRFCSAFAPSSAVPASR